MRMPDSKIGLLTDLITAARKAGADSADAIIFESESLSVSWRLGKKEGVESEESRDLGLRALVGKGQAIVSSTDLKPSTLENLVDRAITMARNAPEDPYCEIRSAESSPITQANLELCDPTEIRPKDLFELAEETEDAARSVEGVTNSEGAEATKSQGHIALASSGGFAAEYSVTNFGASVSVIAGQDTKMERDYEYSSARFFEDLMTPSAIGKSAGEKAVARQGPQKVKSQQVPVILDPRLSGGLPRLLSGLISGASIARGTSILKEKLMERIFPETVSICDDPHRLRGLASRPFDGEGHIGKTRKVVDKGVLTTWLMDTRSANQLGLDSTGHAIRGPSSAPSPGPSNLYMMDGKISRDELIGEIKNGFYITEMMGMSFNSLTGDYSRGASGFWIENGSIAFPVNEMTVAGNILDMFANLTAADDLAFRYSTNAPTVRVDGMTVAGT
ncbi:MAG: TldD/PmbA family protein [Pseudomonadota bacterium]|nr:TldD/PmbA family protein [Pseudomonadota bacterium]